MEFRPITETDLPQVFALYAEHLNSGESIAEGMLSAWNEGRLMGFAAVSEGELAGFFMAREGLAFTYPHPELEAELAGLAGDRRIAYCDALLTLPDYRCNGLAHRLAKACSGLLLEKQFSYFMAEIWIYPDGQSPAKSVFETMGKVVWQRRIDGFYKDLALYDMSCPLCGTSCVCGAWVEMIEL